jgi:hypothetical protein
VAYDGIEFETEAECQHYKGSAFGVFIQQLMECTLTISADGGFINYHLYPKKRHDIFVLEQILKIVNNHEPCGNMCDHLTLLWVKLRCNTVVSAMVMNIEDDIRDLSNGQFAVVSTIKSAMKK